MIRAAVLALCLLSGAAQAETLRIASFNAALSRDYAGHLIRDVERREEQVMQIVEILREVAPDIVLINEFDRDPDGRALNGFRDLLAEAGLNYPHAFAGAVNTGEMTGRDLDGDGRISEPDDAQGWGRWPGHRGMALLSRHPIGTVREFRLALWADQTGSRMPPDDTARDIQRLSSRSHWDAEIKVGDTVLNILAAHPTPPVFDGPEDRNGRRNADEIAWFVRYLDGEVMTDDAGRSAPLNDGLVVVTGDLTADPFDGEARRGPLLALIAHPRLQDPAPTSAGAVLAGVGGANDTHQGPAAQDTTNWSYARGPGNLRVDYVLPDARLRVTASGVFWPAPGSPMSETIEASDHRLVWVDVELP